MPVIKNASWTAENLPEGIVIDSETGILTGTPTEAGEYSVPVSVVTDWGSDVKDMNISVTRASVDFVFTVQAKNAFGSDQKQYIMRVWR